MSSLVIGVIVDGHDASCAIVLLSSCVVVSQNVRCSN